MKESTKNSTVLSIVIPVYNEQDNLLWHHNKISDFFKQRKQLFEIIYVDDGSSDDSLSVIREIHADSPKTTKLISLSRNFGKEAATSAGLSAASGDAAILMDADGQHPVEMVDTFIKLWHEGNDVIVGIRGSNIGEGLVKKYGSKLFYTTLRFIGGKNVVSGTTDFRLIDKKVVDEFNKLTERNRVTRNLLDWLGYKRVEVPFEANERHAGTATYSFRKLFKLAVDGVVSHSTRPLKLIALLGFVISLVSGLAGALLAIQEYVLGDPMNLSITGAALLAVLVTFLIGIVLVCQGLLALYIESVYYETQNRPLFVIAEQSN
jgi:glycosyltransferase involved in cell wall biosynthesis